MPIDTWSQTEEFSLEVEKRAAFIRAEREGKAVDTSIGNSLENQYLSPVDENAGASFSDQMICGPDSSYPHQGSNRGGNFRARKQGKGKGKALDRPSASPQQALEGLGRGRRSRAPKRGRGKRRASFQQARGPTLAAQTPQTFELESSVRVGPAQDKGKGRAVDESSVTFQQAFYQTPVAGPTPSSASIGTVKDQLPAWGGRVHPLTNQIAANGSLGILLPFAYGGASS